MQRPLTELNSRGLATGIIGFVAMIAVVALLYTLMDPAMDQLFGFASADASSQQASTAVAERQKIWSAMPIFGLFLAVVFIIGRSTFESGRP